MEKNFHTQKRYTERDMLCRLCVGVAIGACLMSLLIVATIDKNNIKYGTQARNKSTLQSR